MSSEQSRTDNLTHRLNQLSRDNFYNVYDSIQWPEKLSASKTAMPPELTTLMGTEIWSSLSDEQIHKLTLTETATLFSNTLNGERLLVAGLANCGPGSETIQVDIEEILSKPKTYVGSEQC